MKKIFSLLALSLLVGAPYAFAVELGSPEDQGKKQSKEEQGKQGKEEQGKQGQKVVDQQKQMKMAQQFSVEIPQTLVVRRDSRGNVAIFHSAQKLAEGSRVNSSMKFRSDFARQVRGGNEDLAAWYHGRGFWNFFWNALSPFSYPTYSYYNPYYGFNYNYGYRPYYSYYDPYGYNYYYYRWWW